MGCGESRVVPPSLPRRSDDPAEETVCFEHHDDHYGNAPKLPVEDGDDTSVGEAYEGEFDFVTENSAPELVQKVVQEFRAVDADDLLIVGTPCARLLSAAQRTKLEEAKILESLRNEGLIARPLKKSQNATGFEIIEEKSTSKLALPPPPMRKKREDRPEKPNVTNEMISEKLAKAGERRRQQEEERKARAQTSKPRPSRREEVAEELKAQHYEKWENGIRNREIQLLEMQQKLREKHQRAKGLNFKKSVKGFDPFDDS